MKWLPGHSQRYRPSQTGKPGSPASVAFVEDWQNTRGNEIRTGVREFAAGRVVAWKRPVETMSVHCNHWQTAHENAFRSPEQAARIRAHSRTCLFCRIPVSASW